MTESGEYMRSDVAELDQALDVIMCDDRVGEQENKREDGYVEDCPFINIPVEVFLHICSFLDAGFITQTLSKVCKRFNDILSDDSIWKSRIARSVCGEYPALPVNPESFDWGYACAMIENEYSLWHNKEETMRRILLRNLHNSVVNAVLLSKSGTLCFSSSIDKCLGVLSAWDLNEAVLEGPTPKVVIPDAHYRWIHDLTYLDGKLYSCSWDRSVKSWDIEEGLRKLSIFPCRFPALSITSNENVIAVGLLKGHVMLFDPRMPQNMGSYCIHSNNVLGLTMMNNYIISVSEDKTIGVWDFRNWRPVKKQLLYSKDSYPTSVSYSNDILYVGDVKGMLHLIDPTEGKFNIVEKIDGGYRSKITGIRHNLGSIMTSSTDGTMHIAAPSRSLNPITTIQTEGGTITKFDYKHNVLAMATTRSLVEVWLPKSMHDV